MYKWNDERSLRLQAGYAHNRITQQRGDFKSTTSPMTPYAWMKPTTTACRTMPPIWKCTMRITGPSTICRTASWQKVKRTAAPPTSCSKRCAPPSLRQRISSALSAMEEKTTWKFNSATQYAYLPSSLSLHDGKDKFIQHSLYNDNRQPPKKTQRFQPGNTPPV